MIYDPDIADYLQPDEKDPSKLLPGITAHLNWRHKKDHLFLLREKLNLHIDDSLEKGCRKIAYKKKPA